MDWSSLVGLTLALLGIVLGQAVEGGHLSSLLQPAAFVVVVFGTLGAVLLQSRLHHVMEGVRLLRWVFVPPVDNRRAMLRRIAMWSNIARREGILQLEPQLELEQDAFARKGLRLLIDGAPPERMREICNLELDQYEARMRSAARIWEAAGGYAPTVGILGAVLGLIHVMENLSDPALLGSGIAVAFVATIYGVGLANLVFLPCFNKLKMLIQVDVSQREMVVEALAAIANYEHPRQLEERLQGYLQ